MLVVVVVADVTSQGATAESATNQPRPSDQQDDTVQPTNQDKPADEQPTNQGETVETDS